MDPHLPGDVGALGVDHDEIPLPFPGDFAAALRAFGLIGDRPAVLAGLEVHHAAPPAGFAAVGVAGLAAGFLAAGLAAAPAGRLPDFSSAFLWASWIHSSRPRAGCRIVRPMRLSRGEISDRERDTTRARTL